MRQRIFWVFVIFCLAASGYYAVQYRREQLWLAGKAQEIVRAVHAQSREDQIIAIRDYIRARVRYERLSIEGRPFLRATAKEVLETGQGYCGEATRAFIGLARHLGADAQRVNLHGRVSHVVAEVELKPRRWVLVDVQENPGTNGFLDRQWWTLDKTIGPADSPFDDYSNVNLRRLPFVSLFVQRIKLQSTWQNWVLENPTLLQASLFTGLALLLTGAWAVDRILLRVYAYRLAVAYIPSREWK